MKQISIKSDGTVAGTSVLVDGERVSNVTAVEWSIGPSEKGSYTSRAKLTIAEVELEGEVTGVEVEQRQDFEVTQ